MLAPVRAAVKANRAIRAKDTAALAQVNQSSRRLVNSHAFPQLKGTSKKFEDKMNPAPERAWRQADQVDLLPCENGRAKRGGRGL
jgi:hypothetical protein